MVTEQSVRKQLKEIGFNQFGWGRREVRELPNILLPDEKIFECVNGIYEGGFALLVGTDTRVLLIDKKPLNFLTVEDLRFDMINEIDYNHRLFGAYISITSGDKNLRFRSYNQARLRKLITHVQHCMAESKKKQHSNQEGQNQHLEQINQQLQAYLIAQHQHQQELHAHLKAQGAIPQAEPVKPSPELSDYLFAQSLLAQYRQQTGQEVIPAPLALAAEPAPVTQQNELRYVDPGQQSQSKLQKDIYNEGLQEVFGKSQPAVPAVTSNAPAPAISTLSSLPGVPAIPSIRQTIGLRNPVDIHALRIASSKLPTVLRNRKFNPPAAPFIQPGNEVKTV